MNDLNHKTEPSADDFVVFRTSDSSPNDHFIIAERIKPEADRWLLVLHENKPCGAKAVVVCVDDVECTEAQLIETFTDVGDYWNEVTGTPAPKFTCKRWLQIGDTPYMLVLDINHDSSGKGPTEIKDDLHVDDIIDPTVED